MSNTITLELTAKEALAISNAIRLANERVTDAKGASDFTKSELDAVQLAESIADRCLPFLGVREERQVEVDILWDQFWNQTDTDWTDWFNGVPSACEPDDLDQPKGWPAYRDAGLKALEAVA